MTLNQTIDLLQQTQSALAQTLDARDLWRPSGPDARGRRQQALEQTRARMEALRPRLSEAWRMMLRGSVAMSRAIPAMATPALTGAEAEEAEEAEAALATLPPLAMAEDEDPDEVAADLAEESPGAEG